MRCGVRIRLGLITAATVALLAGCATGGSKAGCPALPVYSQADQSHVAAEMDIAPRGARWPRFIEDYGELRARCRAMDAP